MCSLETRNTQIMLLPWKIISLKYNKSPLVYTNYRSLTHIVFQKSILTDMSMGLLSPSGFGVVPLNSLLKSTRECS